MVISNTFNATTVEDGITYQVESDVGSVTIDAGGTYSLTANLSFWSREGSAERQPMSCYSCVFLKTAGGYSRVSSEYNRAYNSKQTTGKITSLAITPSVLSVSVCLYSKQTTERSGYLTELEIPVRVNGAKGDTNKRMPYYAGRLSEVSGKAVTADDYNTPYVDVGTGTAANPKCYIYVGANTTSGKTYPTTAAAYSSSSDWELMTSDFKYIISSIVFSDYAKLGEWEFKGDYMFSAKDANGGARGGKTFNGIGATTGFIPAAALDASSGTASFSGDMVRFNPDGSGWLAGKNISWDKSGSATFKGDVMSLSGLITLEDTFTWGGNPTWGLSVKCDASKGRNSDVIRAWAYNGLLGTLCGDIYLSKYSQSDGRTDTIVLDGMYGQGTFSSGVICGEGAIIPRIRADKYDTLPILISKITSSEIKTSKITLETVDGEINAFIDGNQIYKDTVVSYEYDYLRQEYIHRSVTVLCVK